MGFDSQVVLSDMGNSAENTAVSRIRLHRSISRLKETCCHMAPKISQDVGSGLRGYEVRKPRPLHNDCTSESALSAPALTAERPEAYH